MKRKSSFLFARHNRADPTLGQIEQGLTDDQELRQWGSNGNDQISKNGNRNHMASGMNEQRLPYDKEKYEARGIEQRVRAHMEDAANQQLKRPVLEIVGVTWIGKTWLLKHFEANFRKDRGQKVGERSSIVIYLDLELLAEQEPSEAQTFRWYTRFLQALISALILASGDESPKELDAARERTLDLPLDPVELRSVLSSLKRWFAELRERYFPILLLDALEKIDASLLAWVERELLVPFVEGNRALIITAGRHPVKWREPEIRFYSDLLRLGALEVFGTKKIPAWIHERYALGHVGLGVKLYDAFQQVEGGIESIRVLEDTAKEQRIVGPILKEGIKKIVLHDVPAQDERGKHMNLQGLLWTLSILRIFNPEILKGMVDAFGPDTYRGKSYMFFRQAAFNLIGSHVAAWRAGLNDYRVEPLIRRIMANAVRIVDGQDEYLKRHKAAEEWYCSTMSSAIYKQMPEFLYHYSVRVHDLEPDTLRQRVLAETRALIAKQRLEDTPTELDALIHRLTNQDDDDLKELSQDMLGVVGERTYQQILKVLQETIPTGDLVPAM